MQNKEWTTIDKSSWGDGPWQNEPDKMQFTDIETGYPCLIVRNQLGALCGYVGISKTHPLHGHSGYSLPDGYYVEVHGGVTFVQKCQPGAEAESICHAVDGGADDDVMWIGFDCAHLGDLVPVYNVEMKPIWQKIGYERDFPEFYRHIDYVKDEIQSLAKQLKEMDNTDSQNKK